MSASNHFSGQNPIASPFPQPCLSASQTIELSQNNAEYIPFLPNFDSYPQPCFPASEFILLSQDNAVISASNGFAHQNPISTPLHPNLSSFPQPSPSTFSILSFPPGISLHMSLLSFQHMPLLFLRFHFLYSFDDLIYIQ